MSFDPRTLIIADYPLVRENGTLKMGQVLDIGAVLGKIVLGAVAAAAIVGTGNATISAPTKLANCQLGVYKVVFRTATHFDVFDPGGKFIGLGATGVAFANQIGFTITVGGVACVEGDYFNVTVAAGSGKLVIVDSTAVDGSGVPVGVLAEQVDATASDLPVCYYATGIFSESALDFGGTDTIDTHRAALRALTIWARPVAAGGI